MSANSEDKKFIVVENGQRSSATMPQAEAETEAASRKRLVEDRGPSAPTPKIEVKQNLNG